MSAKKEISKEKKENPKQINSLKLKVKFYSGLGSCIIFLSWVTQNFMQEKWKNEIDNMERNKIAVAFNEVNKNTFQIFLNEEISRSKDSSYDSNLQYASKAYSNYANMLQYLGTSLTITEEKQQKYNDSIYNYNASQIVKFSESGNVNQLIEFSRQLSKWENENGNETINIYQKRISNIRELETYWNRVHLILYIIGAIFLAKAFLVDYKITLKE